MYSIKYSKIARLNLLEIQNYIAQDNLYYSIKVLKNIESSIWYLKDFPYLWTCINKKLRKIVNSKYWYTIFYKLNEIEKQVEIVSISKYQD